MPIQFIESRCDPHALAEIKQPTKFIAQVQLGDGSVHPYIIYPERDYWIPMRLTADKACFQLGKVEFLGENPDVRSVTRVTSSAGCCRIRGGRPTARRPASSSSCGGSAIRSTARTAPSGSARRPRSTAG